MAGARCAGALLVGSLLVPALAAAQDFEARGFRLDPTSPRQATDENLAAGKILYDKNCSQCHGEKGDAQGVVADLLDPAHATSGGASTRSAGRRRVSCRPMKTCS